MPDVETMNEEQLRRLYHQVTTKNAEAFAHEIGEILSTHLPKSEITMYGTRIHPNDLYPNDYSTLLLGVLQSQGYPIISYPLNLNGTSDPIESIPAELITGKVNMIVDFHISRIFGLYLARLKMRNAQRTLYACPIPPPGSLWEYSQENKRLTRLQKSSV